MSTTSLKARALEYYEKNETKVDVAFFLSGFLFDILTLSDIDDPLSIAQQVLYLFVTGAILYFDHLESMHVFQPRGFVAKIWAVRKLAFHFLLGGLLSIYSLFFLKSASLFSSAIFVLAILFVLISNELKFVQRGALGLKAALHVICIFSFYSILYPVLLGFVGRIPFLLATLSTIGTLFLVYKLLLSRIQNKYLLIKTLVAPCALVLTTFLGFYVMGWIPPVPLSVQNMGIYHGIEKKDGAYILSHENPWWKFWNNGDQSFVSAPGDKIYFFAKIFSPGRFDDTVILHWYYKDPRAGWQSTDKIPMRVTGGRKGGYRGFSVKQNFSEGQWCISVETTDGREIGRIYFSVSVLTEMPTERVFTQNVFL